MVRQKSLLAVTAKKGKRVRLSERTNSSTDELMLSLINRRQRQILLHSYIYYDLNKNVISDFQFDSWAYDLVRLMRENPNEAKKSEFYTDFKDFDGSTGMDLTYRQPFTIYWGSQFVYAR